jgi:putative hydrolase of the HAD superfamily
MRADGLTAVTVDAFGTAVELEEPVPRLRRALAARGVRRSPEEVAAAFRAEVAFYVPRSHVGRDPASLHELQRDSVAVFLTALDTPLEAAPFVDDFLAALRFRPLPGAAEALSQLRAAGLRLACVSNWDVTLRPQLERAGLGGLFDAIVSSAEARAAKPDPRIFLLALERLGVPPAAALHVGDSEPDRAGARAAGLRFAPPPLVTLPARLGLDP